MKSRFIFLVFCFFAASALLQNCTHAEEIASVNSEISANKAKDAENDARFWSSTILKPEYGLPAGAQYNLRPRVKKTDYDKVEVKYNTSLGTVVMTQTRLLLAFHLQFFETQKDAFTPLQAEAVAKKIFRKSENLSLRATGSVEYKKESPVWLNIMRWSCDSNGLKFYMFKTATEHPQELIGYGLMSNAYWFTNLNGGFREFLKLDAEGEKPEAQLFAEQRIEDEKQISDEAINFAYRTLTASYAPPAGLLYSFFANDTGENDTLKMRYFIQSGESGGKQERLISLTQTPQTFNVTVTFIVKPLMTFTSERLRFQNELNGINPTTDLGDVKMPLTSEQIEDLSKELFFHDGDVTVEATENQAQADVQPPAQGTITLKGEKQEENVRYFWTQDKESIKFSVPKSPEATEGKKAADDRFAKDAKRLDLTEYLVKKGAQLDCYFTIERQNAIFGEPFLSLFVGKVQDRDSVQTIDSLVAQLRQELPEVEVRQDSQVKTVIHLIDKGLADDPSYSLNKRVSVPFTGSLKELIASNQNVWKLRLQYGVNSIPRSSLVQPMMPRSSAVQPVEQVTTLASPELEGATIRQVLTGYTPLSRLDRILWIVSRSPYLEGSFITINKRTPFYSIERSFMMRRLGLPREPQPFSKGELAYVVNPDDAQKTNDAISFINESAGRSQVNQIRWAMFYLGKYKVEKAIPILLQNLDYVYVQSAIAEERFPALRALSEIGEPSASAALERLRTEYDPLRVELLARVVLAVDGNEVGKARIEALLAQLPSDRQAYIVRAGLEKATKS